MKGLPKTKRCNSVAVTVSVRFRLGFGVYVKQPLATAESRVKIWPVKHRTLSQKQNFEPVHEISNNLVCATSKASDQPAHMRSLIRAFASRLGIL